MCININNIITAFDITFYANVNMCSDKLGRNWDAKFKQKANWTKTVNQLEFSQVIKP